MKDAERTVQYVQSDRGLFVQAQSVGNMRTV